MFYIPPPIHIINWIKKLKKKHLINMKNTMMKNKQNDACRTFA